MSDKTKTPKKKPTGLPVPKVYDSPTLAMYPIAPVARNPKYDLVRQEDGILWNTNRVEWTGIHPETGEPTPWFIERRVIQGTPTLPNYKTQQILNALLHILLEQKGDDLSDLKIKISLSEVLRVLNGKQELDYTPGSKHLKMVMNHINALRNMRVSYGYTKNAKGETYRNESNIISDIELTTFEGKRQKKKLYGEGEIVEQNVTITEIHSITFSSGFIAKYMAERITYDLFPYLRHDSPTAQNAYRFLNYLIQTSSKDFYYRDDLQKFCRVHLALQSQKTENKEKASRLAADMRKELKTIRKRWEGDFAIEKDKKQPSGYSISFGRRPRLFDVEEDLHLNEKEKEAYSLLRYFGVYHVPAVNTILECQKSFYEETGEYILYCIKSFDNLRRLGEIKAPIDKLGGVLVTFIKNGYHYEPFLEELAKAKNEPFTPDFTFAPVPETGGFNFTEFKKRYPKICLEIQERVQKEMNAIMKSDFSMANSEVFMFAAVRAECYKYWKEKCKK